MKIRFINIKNYEYDRDKSSLEIYQNNNKTNNAHIVNNNIQMLYILLELLMKFNFGVVVI